MSLVNKALINNLAKHVVNNIVAYIVE